MQTFDAIVVGLGAAGAAATHALARRGASVLGLDQYDPPHARGSSHGDTRITRLLYNAGAQLPLVRRSQELWRELEAEYGVSLFTTTGGLFIGNPASEGRSWIEGLTDDAERGNITYEVLEGQDARRRFPAFLLRGDEPVLYEPEAGVLRPEACIDVQLRAARSRGAQIRTGERVTALEESTDGVIVRTGTDVYGAERVIVAAGPWVTQFLREDLRTHVSTYRQVLYWFAVDGDLTTLTPPAMPVFVWQMGTTSHHMFYGFPAMAGREDGIKMAGEQYEHPADDFDALHAPVTEHEVEKMYARFASRLAGVGPRLVRAATCIYTVTSDLTYLIDWQPGSDRVLLASPCMGRGFKHSAAIGEALAEVAVSGTSTIDLSEYRFGRRFTG